MNFTHRSGTGRFSKAAAAALSLVVFVAVSGCMPPLDETNGGYAVTRPIPSAPPNPENVAPAPTVGGDGSAIRLSALSAGDIQTARLQGELVCAFAEQGRTLLYASGDVASTERATGIVKIGDYVEPISAPGGFDGILRGAIFAGRGTTVSVARTSDQPIGGGESPAHPATLTFQRADGASRVFTGNWTCGP
ncbi:MAG: hypothetical protein ACK4YU_12930 [Paracoccus sp. (in: a-proteobacteria)]